MSSNSLGRGSDHSKIPVPCLIYSLQYFAFVRMCVLFVYSFYSRFIRHQLYPPLASPAKDYQIGAMGFMSFWRHFIQNSVYFVLVMGSNVQLKVSISITYPSTVYNPVIMHVWTNHSNSSRSYKSFIINMICRTTGGYDSMCDCRLSCFFRLFSCKLSCQLGHWCLSPCLGSFSPFASFSLIVIDRTGSLG